jgi:hypothetical protein
MAGFSSGLVNCNKDFVEAAWIWDAVLKLVVTRLQILTRVSGGSVVRGGVMKLRDAKHDGGWKARQRQKRRGTHH